MERIIMFYYEEESGQGLIEYAFILSIVSVAAILIIMVLGMAVTNLFNEILIAFTDVL
jgi:Flp pilus assembly pilin Flp